MRPLPTGLPRLQWHRARKHLSDPPFSSARIVEGLVSGAAVEIDLVLTADHHFAILHDAVLDRETTGEGAVAQYEASAVKRLFRRDERGEALAETVATLSDIVRDAAAAGIHPETLLHLDYKLDNAALSEMALENFAAAIAPLPGQVLVTTGDLAALARLGDADETIRIGFDPMETECMAELIRTRDLDHFADNVVAACPRAEMIALHYPLLEKSALAGFDLVGAFRARGRWVDAYTLAGSLPHHAALAGFLIEAGVAMIACDDPAGLAAALGPRARLLG